MPEYTIIDVDTHVSEAPDLWTSRVPARRFSSVLSNAMMVFTRCCSMPRDEIFWKADG